MNLVGEASPKKDKKMNYRMMIVALAMLVGCGDAGTFDAMSVTCNSDWADGYEQGLADARADMNDAPAPTETPVPADPTETPVPTCDDSGEPLDCGGAIEAAFVDGTEHCDSNPYWRDELPGQRPYTGDHFCRVSELVAYQMGRDHGIDEAGQMGAF